MSEDTYMKSRIVRKNGVLMIEIDGKTYPPLAFKSFRPDQNNISDNAYRLNSARYKM